MKRKRSKKIIKAVLVLPLVLGLLFFCFSSGQGPVLAQTASLVATVRINPLEIEVTAPLNVVVGEWFTVSVSVFNRGSETIWKAIATLEAPTGIVVRGKNKKLGNLEPGEIKTVFWQAKANKAGNFIILAKVTGNLVGEQISASDTTTISASSTSRFSLISLFRRLIFRS